MSIRKRTLPSGGVRWQVDYRDRNGTRRHRQFATKAAAVAAETTIRAELAGGVHVADAASITVAEAGALWLERGTNEGLEPRPLGNVASTSTFTSCRSLGRLGCHA
jgi:hypothetical protein